MEARALRSAGWGWDDRRISLESRPILLRFREGQAGTGSEGHHESRADHGPIPVTREFSARTRAAHLAEMQEDVLDVLVIGGGIVGAGIARDAARRGLRTGLLDRGDFASGTSGKTSRLIHGGLRYLQTYRFGLVRSAARERDRLLDAAPALVHPLPFVIPAYKGRKPGPRLLRFGLFLYDLLSTRRLPRRVWLRGKAASDREPLLARTDLAGAGIYYDAWADDARFVLAVVQDAAAAGALVANYVEVTRLTRDGRRSSRRRQCVRGPPAARATREGRSSGVGHLPRARNFRGPGWPHLRRGREVHHAPRDGGGGGRPGATTARLARFQPDAGLHFGTSRSAPRRIHGPWIPGGHRPPSAGPLRTGPSASSSGWPRGQGADHGGKTARVGRSRHRRQRGDGADLD